MYFLLCCFSVMQCQLSLFKGGYLKGRRDKACTQSRRYSVWPAGWSEKKKRGEGEEGGRGREKGKAAEEEGERKASSQPRRRSSAVKRKASQCPQKKRTMLTVSQIPLIASRTKRRKAPLSRRSTSTNNARTKPPNPWFCSATKKPLDGLNAPTVGHTKKSGGRKAFFSLLPPALLPSFPWPEREKRRGREEEMEGGGIVSELIISVFEKGRGDL